MKKMLMSFFIICLLSVAGKAYSVGVGIGPFSVSLPVDVRVDSPYYKLYHDPICQAIEERKLLVLFVETEDKKVEQVVIEPYAFGYNAKEQLVLQGYRVESANFSKQEVDQDNGEGNFGGVMSSFQEGGWTDIALKRVIEVKVLPDTTFTLREDSIKNLKEANQIVDTICQVE